MSEPGNDNGAAVTTPGGWLIRLGGPLVILAAAFAGVIYLGWLDRQAQIEYTDRRYREVYTELRFIRCALMFDAATKIVVRDHLHSDRGWEELCKWLEFSRGIPPSLDDGGRLR